MISNHNLSIEDMIFREGFVEISKNPQGRRINIVRGGFGFVGEAFVIDPYSTFHPTKPGERNVRHMQRVWIYAYPGGSCFIFRKFSPERKNVQEKRAGCPLREGHLLWASGSEYTIFEPLRNGHLRQWYQELPSQEEGVYNCRKVHFFVRVSAGNVAEAIVVYIY